MTKLLSQLLEAQEPQFRQTINRLESASGHNCHDIHLSESINRETREKIKLLSLDPDDTTNEELYYSLQEKVRSDDAKLVKKLRNIAASNISAEGDIAAGMCRAVSDNLLNKQSFGVKNIAIKRYLSKSIPKKTMKLLGYRSISSMLKHEPVALIIIAAKELEPISWLKSYNHFLLGLTSRDCEDRNIAIYNLKNSRWGSFTKIIIENKQQTVLLSKELTSIMILSLPDNQEPTPGLTTATLALALNSVNAIITSGSYLKLSQVTADFGQRLMSCVSVEPTLGFSLLEQSLSWETVMRFFYHMVGKIDSALTEQVDIETMINWQPIEAFIQKIEPELSFWLNSSHLGRADSNSVLSMNILDNALNLCNGRQFKDNFYGHLQRALWQEFILRYIRPDLLREAINTELQPKLAAELVEA